MKLQSIKTRIWNAGAFTFFTGIVLYAIFLLGSFLLDRVADNLCSKTQTQELPSPNGNKIAELGYVDCGATTNWVSSISIHDLASGKNYRGLFVMDGKPEGLSLKWENDYTLAVSGFSIEKLQSLKQDNFSGVRLVLKP